MTIAHITLSIYAMQANQTVKTNKKRKAHNTVQVTINQFICDKGP